MSLELCKLLTLDGTIHQSSCTDTPQQNDIAGRKYRHIAETAHSLLLYVYIPSYFWGKAVLTAIHIINKIPTSYTIGLS